MSWLDKLLPSRISTSDKRQVPDDLWSKCDACEATIYTAELDANQRVCPKCAHHMRLSARKRLEAFFDKGSMTAIGEALRPVDKLKFKDSKTYKDRIKAAQKATSESEALIAFAGRLEQRDVVAAAFEFSYMGGSMGSVVGEKFTQSVERAIALQAPFVCFAASGGARMQEGLISLMQMAKTSAALTQLSAKKLPFVSVLTDPTMGGVSASFAMLGDLIIAEPKALIGFAGPRVIEQTVRETLPEGFQRSEFLLEKGAIDMIVDRRQMRKTLASVFAALMHQRDGEMANSVTAGDGQASQPCSSDSSPESSADSSSTSTVASASASTSASLSDSAAADVAETIKVTDTADASGDLDGKSKPGSADKGRASSPLADASTPTAQVVEGAPAETALETTKSAEPTEAADGKATGN